MMMAAENEGDKTVRPDQCVYLCGQAENACSDYGIYRYRGQVPPADAANEFFICHAYF